MWVLAIDDTDSPYGGCTTYVLTQIIDALHSNFPEVKFIGYPRLIRLNPNVPFKTRGNGALAVFFKLNETHIMIYNLVLKIFKEESFAQAHRKENCPFLYFDKFQPGLSIYKDALVKIVDFQALTKLGIETRIQINRGAVGAFSAVHADLTDDYTFELIAYRNSENLTNKRKINKKKVYELAKKYQAKTFSSFDFSKNRELILPSGDDPVFLGIRGDSTTILEKMVKELSIEDQIESYMIFITNQGTGAHTKFPQMREDIFSVVSMEVTLIDDIQILRGGHTKFLGRINLKSYTIIAFEPTKILCKSVQKLQKGDIIYIHGAFRKNEEGVFISIEQIRIIDLVARYKKSTPTCLICNRKLRKKGKLKGYKCYTCKLQRWEIEKLEVSNPFFPGEIIYASKSAQRHLTRPWEREFRKNKAIKNLESELNYEKFRTHCIKQ